MSLPAPRSQPIRIYRRAPAHPALDRVFLHPRWGALGSLLVFAGVLLVVFEASAWLDAMTTARLAAAVSGWQPPGAGGVAARAIADGLVGLVGIVVPYMIPLVALLVALEQCGIMPRVARVIDRAFHRVGLHGGMSVAFLTGLGCNVPAIANVAAMADGRARVIAALLVTFVPCSARSAIILALGAKYLGAWGVMAVFAAAGAAIAILGRALSHRGRDVDAGAFHPIPPYRLPRLSEVLAETWRRSRDVFAIVMPLLVAGSLALAFLSHLGADRVLNAALAPVTAAWLGLPVALGVPLLFGVLRKELSLLMIFQALGTQEVGTFLDPVQVMTLLLFVTFYFPCASTFAVMARQVGMRHALRSAAITLVAAMGIAGAARFAMTLAVGWAA